jgi:hypothetical protein
LLASCHHLLAAGALDTCLGHADGLALRFGQPERFLQRDGATLLSEGDGWPGYGDRDGVSKGLSHVGLYARRRKMRDRVEASNEPAANRLAHAVGDR